MRALRGLTFAAIAALLVACGGGGGGGGTTPSQSSGTPVSSSSPAAAGPTTAAFALIIPSASATSSSRVRRPAFVSPAIQSVAIFAAAGTAALPPTASTLVNVGPNAAGCTSVAAGTSCTIDVPAVIGAMTFLVKTYTGTFGSGTLLSQATFSTTIVAGQQPIPLTLTGTVASVSLSLRTTSLPGGSGTAILDVNALDPSGATIVGSGAYSVPINVGSSDPGVTLSATSVTAPNQPITVTASAPTIVEFTANAAGLSGNATAPAILTVGSTYARVFAGDQNNSRIDVLPSIATFPMSPLYSISLPAYINALASNASGTLAVAASNQVLTYNAGATTPSSTLSTSFILGNNSLALDAAGNLYVLVYGFSTNLAIVEYPPGATSQTAYSRFIGGAPTTMVNGGPIAVDGSGNIFEVEYLSTHVNEWTAGQSGGVAPARTLTLPAGASPAGIAADSAGNVAVLTYQNAGTLSAVVQFFAPGATSPTRSWSPSAGNADAIAYGPNGVLYASGSAGTVGVVPATGQGYTRSFGVIGASGYTEPLAVGGSGTVSAPPAVTTVTGDFIAASASKTWNYTATAPNSPNYTMSIYTDPQPDVAGNLALVAFMSQTAVADAATGGGTVVGAAGLLQSAAGYTVQSYGSVSNDSFGLIPGGPLLVPASLTYGQQLALYPGVTATVTGVGTVPGMSACPNSPTVGATVAYAAGSGGSFSVSYVPGCGITDFNANGAGDFRLSSITHDTQLGQQAIARRVLSVTAIDTIRTIWQHAFRPWVKM